MRQTTGYRLNRVAFVGYHPAVIWGERSGSCQTAIILAEEGRTSMDVSGLGSVQGSGGVRPTPPANLAKPTEGPSKAASPKDELELSTAGQALDRLNETPEMRAERLAQIKAQIDAGAYDTDEKLDAALSRMFDSLGVDLDDE